MALDLLQMRAILWKNFLIGLRLKEFLRQIISVLILGTFLVILERADSNNFLSPFYMAMAIIGYSRSVVFGWVLEKQTFQKEMQNIMGISYFTYYISWLIYFLLNALYVCTLMLLIVYFGVVIPNSDFQFSEGYGFVHIVLLYLVYAVSIIGFVLFMSVFFNKAKVAAQAMIFIQLLLNFLYFLRFSDNYRTNKLLLWLTALFPQVSFNLGICSIAFIDSRFPTADFSYQNSITALVGSGILFLLLAIYLEQVLPNAQGTNKNPLFFLNSFRRQVNEVNDQMPLLLDNEENSANYYEIKQQNQHPIIKLQNLTKKFREKVAVDNITMRFYPNQIFCLLGHNGAGKSTTINLLTGLLKPTSGNISLLGMDYWNNKDEIRRNIGLCLQFNVLYEDLTIEQHLKFYALLKKIDTQNINQNIQDIINECSLATQKGKFVKNLSGGNKRKVSLANALIGKSRIIFLDEPSSGLDPTSRQGIWNIIKQVKTPQRCLILTTHHLQEAEELSQTIGIMGDGKMVIIGSSQFIKQKFNVGFHVILSFNENTKANMNQCRKIVFENIPSAKQDQQTAINSIKFLLNTSQTKNFGSIFGKLEPLCSLSVKASSLEDSFIKLGQQSGGDQIHHGIDEQISLPNFECSYSFKRQFKAVFFRKFTTTFRSISTVVSIVLPTFFILMGVLMACLVVTGEGPQVYWIRRFLLAYFMVWAFLFNTSTFCGDLVLQREKRFKYLSHVLGLRKFSYWAANYTFDILIFTIPLIFFFIIIYLIGNQAKFITDVVGYIILSLIIFSFAFIGYSYLFSFMFQKSSTAFRLFPFFNFLVFFSIPQIIINLAPQGFAAQYVVPLVSPFIAFYACFFTKQIMQIEIQNQYFSKSYTFNIICLALQSLIFLMIAIYIQNLRFRLKDRQILNDEDQHINEQLSDSIYQNNDQNTDINDEIYVSHLYKKYSNGYMAIRDNSFSVKKGQIFGLLGPNGAGKSTTFNIVTAALPKTSGQVRILHQNINNGIMDIFSQFGVCPQYDSIYQNMTTEEHIYYVARLKGIEQSQINDLAAYYYELLSLTPYIKVKAGNLSGGNKRKLCVSMAMLANPKIMFFDEPSSGVDPISRRFLWKSLYLSARTKNASMVLTTHTMSQAESLCSRIGILIKGKFVCVASPADLKLKYGKGFRVGVKLDFANQNQIRQAATKEFGENVHIQKAVEAQTIVFTIDNSEFSYSKAYHLFDNVLLQKGLIKKYQIKQSTLEEVFLFLSQMQPEPDQSQHIKEPWQFCCWECGANGCQWI